MSKVANGVCGALAVFAMVYALFNAFPLFLGAVGIMAVMFGYAWLNRKVQDANEKRRWK